jgi:hypothetical protein
MIGIEPALGLRVTPEAASENSLRADLFKRNLTIYSVPKQEYFCQGFVLRGRPARIPPALLYWHCAVEL